MSAPTDSNLRALIRGHLAVAIVFISGFLLVLVKTGAPGSDLSSRRAEVEAKRPELVLVGNSLLRAAVDADEFSRLSGLRTLNARSNGSSSLWWYLYIKNVIAKTQHKPRYVGIMFRDSFLTEPAYRVTGSYQKPIRQMMTDHEPLAEKLSFSGLVLDDYNSPLSWVPREARNWLNLKIEKRTENVLRIRQGEGRRALKDVFAADRMQQKTYNEFQLAYEDVDAAVSYDFHAQVDHSYLPHILKLLKEQNITPLFIRAKRRRDLDDQAEPREVQEYIRELTAYLTSHGALLLDFSHEERLTEAHFGPGDHLSTTDGRQLFMRLLSDQLTPTLAMQESDRQIR